VAADPNAHPDATHGALAKKFGIDLKATENLVDPTTLKNDPGIYAAEKAAAAGLIGPPKQDATPDTKTSGLDKLTPPPAPPPAPPPPPPQPKVPDPKAPAVQADPTKAGPSATPGKPPPGMLPTGMPSHWESSPEPAPVTATQKAALKALPIANEAIKAYTGSTYDALNTTLRSNESNTAGSMQELGKLSQGTALLSRRSTR
jgi:hypothetical protein